MDINRYAMNSQLRCTTWNIATINDNPFEYYMDSSNTSYSHMLNAVEKLIDMPSARECTLDECMPPRFISGLFAHMHKRPWYGVDKVHELWENTLKHQFIVSDFLKNAEIGRKRLISMPGRMTNTVSTPSGKSYRPSVISPYTGPALASKTVWSRAWLRFMFDVYKDASPHCSRLSLIPRAKYPALTAEEEKISVPLQTLYLALFDCVLIHLLDLCAPKTWRSVRKQIVHTCIHQKEKNTLKLLSKRYCDNDVLCLQEVAASFVTMLRTDKRMSKQYVCVAPASMDTKRDQNSVLLISKQRFDTNTLMECTDNVLHRGSPLNRKKVQPGDLVAVTVTERTTGLSHLIASFHGDTNGLATINIVQALCSMRKHHQSNVHALIIGIDANSYHCKKTNKTRGKYLHVTDLQKVCNSLGLSSCWGHRPKWSNCYTTGTARTFLQPQLNKAIRHCDIHKTGIVESAFQPKDFILVSKDMYTLVSGKTTKDNTGKGQYREGILFPTIEFPSDHAIVTTMYQPNMSSSSSHVRTRRTRGGNDYMRLSHSMNGTLKKRRQGGI